MWSPESSKEGWRISALGIVSQSKTGEVVEAKQGCAGVDVLNTTDVKPVDLVVCAECPPEESRNFFCIALSTSGECNHAARRDVDGPSASTGASRPLERACCGRASKESFKGVLHSVSSDLIHTEWSELYGELAQLVHRE
jgi:hypothetical protein